jgi:hypothetical protein
MHDGPLADLFRSTDVAKEVEAQREIERMDETQMMEPPAPPVQAAPEPASSIGAPHIQPVPDPVDEPGEGASRPAAATMIPLMPPMTKTITKPMI